MTQKAKQYLVKTTFWTEKGKVLKSDKPQSLNAEQVKIGNQAKAIKEV